jgi:hypothetical protein
VAVNTESAVKGAFANMVPDETIKSARPVILKRRFQAAFD